MIIKNGEILAIDHIAHDNTLSGNGTSAKPVGLSETYKSSVANQIKNVNDRLTSVNSALNTRIDNTNSEISNFESSAHDVIARIDSSIAAVSAAKVDKTTFTQYQTEVANNFTAVNKRIDDVSAAKVDKTTFTQYQTDVAGEITRVDEKIDTTSANLRDNYYKTSETYNRTEINEKFANFGGFKFRDPDPEHGNQPLTPGEVKDPKAIYLTQPAGASQYLQWIWDIEKTVPEWKCIGDTTMDLSDYAKTVDVVASANANKTEVKNWADGKFETQQNFESVISGYYTKGEADDLLDTKVDKTAFETYQQTVSDAFDSVDRDFDNTSAWANNTFATKTDLNNDKSELEREISNLSTDIESDITDVSGKIINKLNDVETTLDNKINNVDTKIDTVSGELVGKIETVEETLSDDIDDVNENVEELRTELERNYYDAATIEEILAASGDYYDKDEIDSLLDNYVKTEDLEPINEKIDSVSAEFNKYYTKTEVDDKFTTKDTFDNTITDINNDLDDIVDAISAIDQDKADKSDLNDYYKISETSGRDELSGEFAKYTKTEDLHIPTTVAELTDSSNYYKTTETSGKNELSAAFDAILKYDVTAAAGIEITTATDAGVKTFGISLTAEPVVTDTKISGYNGIAAALDGNISGQWNIGLTQDILNTIDGKLDSSDAAQTYLTKTDAAETYQEIGNYLENTDIELNANKITAISGKELAITAHQSLANYYTKSEVDTALNDKADTSELETVSGEIVNMIPSLNGYATEQYVQGASAEVTAWVVDKHYLVTNDIAGKADKTDLQYVSAGVNYVSGAIPDTSDMATQTWVGQQGYLSAIPSEYITETELAGYNYVTTATTNSLSSQVEEISSTLNDKYTLSAGTGIYFYEDIINKTTRIDCTVTAATTVAQLTDSANYYTKSQTSAASALSAEFAKYLTTAQYATDSATFVTSGDYISGSKQYALTSGGWEEITAGDNYTAGTDLKIDENNVISVDTNGTANNTATNNHNFVAGSWSVASGYNCFAEGVATSALGYGVHAQGMWTCFSSTDGQTTGGGSEPIYWGNGAGAIVEGYCNATTACPMSGTAGESDYGPVHGGIIKVIGNGRVENEDHETTVHEHYPSDALILYRDGSLSAAGKISAAGIELGAKPDLSDYIPYSATQLPIGTNNDVSNYSMGIGYANTANYGDVTTNHVQYGSLAFGYENSAGKMSFAAGNGNTAYHVGFAVGYHCSANEHAVAMNNDCTAYDYAFAAGNNCKAGNYSFAEGNGTSAYNRSFAAGEGSTATDHSFAFGLTQCYANRESFVAGNASTADDFSFACGPANKAYKHSYVIGRGLEFSGAYTGGYHLGAFVVGGWNATKSWSGPTASSPLFIVGNGTGNDANRSDAMIVYRDGNVSAKQFQNADGTDTIHGTTYNFSGVDNIEILPLAATANTANFPDDNVLRFILES